jgi:hypothetical protein
MPAQREEKDPLSDANGFGRKAADTNRATVPDR